MPARIKTTETQRTRSIEPDEDFRTRLIEGSPDCIKVLDLDGRLLSMNAGGMTVLELCDLKPFIGAAWIDFWQGEDRMEERARVRAVRLI